MIIIPVLAFVLACIIGKIVATKLLAWEARRDAAVTNGDGGSAA